MVGGTVVSGLDISFESFLEESLEQIEEKLPDVIKMEMTSMCKSDGVWIV